MSIVLSPSAAAPAPLTAPVRRAAAELPLLACWLNVLVAAFAQPAPIPGRARPCPANWWTWQFDLACANPLAREDTLKG